MWLEHGIGRGFNFTMILYRAMCEKEFQDMCNFNSLSWNSKFKWFGTEEFVFSRVIDGKFNNSRFVQDRYFFIVKFVFSDDSLQYFTKCGHKEHMLNVRKCPMVKLLSWKLVKNLLDTQTIEV